MHKNLIIWFGFYIIYTCEIFKGESVNSVGTAPLFLIVMTLWTVSPTHTQPKLTLLLSTDTWKIISNFVSQQDTLYSDTWLLSICIHDMSIRLHKDFSTPTNSWCRDHQKSMHFPKKEKELNSSPSERCFVPSIYYSIPGAHKGKEQSTLNYVVIIFNTYLCSTAI